MADKDIQKIISAIQSSTGFRRAGYVSDELLARFAEGLLETEEQDMILDHLSKSLEDLAALAAVKEIDTDVVDSDRSDSKKRILALWNKLPICELSLGVAEQGIKVFRGKGTSLAPDRGRLRMPRVLPPSLRLSEVCSFASAIFLVRINGTEVSLQMKSDKEGLVGTLFFPKGSCSAPVNMDFYEADNLLLSETIHPGEPYTLPGAELGRSYFIEFSGGIHGELALKLESTAFGLKDIISMAIYHISCGDVQSALKVCEEGVSVEGAAENILSRLCVTIRAFSEFFPELRMMFGRAAYRDGSVTNMEMTVEMEESLRRVLRTQVRGEWSGRLPSCTGKPDSWSEINQQLARVLKENPDNQALHLVHDVLSSWLEKGERAQALDVALSALLGQFADALDDKHETSSGTTEQTEDSGSG